MLSYKCISLIGWNGKRNVGDDAMTAVIVNYVRQRICQGAKFRLLADDACLASYDADQLAPIGATKGAAKRANGTDISGFTGYNRFQQIPYVRRWLNPLLFDRRLATASPLLLVGGGSIFHSVFRSRRLAKVVAATHRAHRESLIGALGVSLGPFKTGAEQIACREVLEQLDFVAVRDQRSWEVLQQLKVEIPAVRAMDIALLLPELIPLPSLPAGGATEVGVALRQGHTPPAMLTALAASLNALQAADPTVRVGLLNFSDVDEPVSAQLQQQLQATDRVRLYPYTDRPAQMYQRIKHCRLVLASRLHAAVIAYGVGTPFGVLSYHQKCVDFAAEVGLDSDWVMSVDALSVERLEAQLTTAVIQQRLPQTTLPLPEAVAKARTSFQFLDPQRSGTDASVEVIA